MSALEGRKRKTRVSYPSLAGAKISKGNTELTELRSGLEDYSTKKKKRRERTSHLLLPRVRTEESELIHTKKGDHITDTLLLKEQSQPCDDLVFI